MNSITNKKYILFLIALTIICISSSCDNITKKTVKKVSSEVAEGSTKKATKHVVKKMNWDDLLLILSKENPILEKGLRSFSGNFRKSIVDATNIDGIFLSSLSSSRTLIDEYYIFVKNASGLSKNADFFRWFAKSNYSSKSLGKVGALDGIIAKEINGVYCLVDNKTSDIIAKYSNGILKFSNIDNKFFTSNLFKGDLLPNSLYKLKGTNGLEYTLSVDNLGRILKVESKGTTPDDLVNNILRRDGYIDLGQDWNSSFKTIKQTSKGNDVSAIITFKYADDGITPQHTHIKIDISGKQQIAKSFSNIHKSAEYEEIIKRFAKFNNFPIDKQTKLLTEMSEDKELAKLILNNPNLNIQRWLNTRNHVDKSLLAITPKGEFPKNGRIYAGNVYYFNPHLNSGLKARLTRNNGYANLRGIGQLSYADLIKLDKMYPNGVPFTKEGFPDFSKVAAKNSDGTPILINIGTLTGDSQKDINIAETIFQEMGNKWEAGYTWHHVENTTTLLRVPTNIHQLVDHTGGMSMSGLK
jgi:hypothetical protein